MDPLVKVEKAFAFLAENMDPKVRYGSEEEALTTPGAIFQGRHTAVKNLADDSPTKQQAKLVNLTHKGFLLRGP